MIYSTSKRNFEKKTIHCSACHAQNMINLKSTNYFMTIDMIYQLKMLLAQDQFKYKVLVYLQSRKDKEIHNEKTNVITDVYDSELHKKINNNNNDEEVHEVITYNFSTDGAPLTKSGKRAFWPLQLIFNFLPPFLRFKYVILVGMLMCTAEPNSNIADYFSKFIEQVKLLYSQGLQILNLHKQKIFIKFCPMSCIVD